MSCYLKKCYHFSQIFQDWPILNFQEILQIFMRTIFVIFIEWGGNSKLICEKLGISHKSKITLFFFLENIE